jgi:hypothetical protein
VNTGDPVERHAGPRWSFTGAEVCSIYFGVLLFALALPLLGQQDDRVVKLLKELSSAPRPSGYEGPVRDILRREFQEAGLEVSIDGMGSVIGVLRGSTDGCCQVMSSSSRDITI